MPVEVIRGNGLNEGIWDGNVGIDVVIFLFYETPGLC